MSKKAQNKSAQQKPGGKASQNGKSSGGRPACSPWGLPDGRKTRKRKKASSKLIIRRRKNLSEKGQ